MRVADDLQPSVFFQDVQAGFVVSYQEPGLSFCAVSDSSRPVSSEVGDLIQILYYTSAYNLSSCEDITSCENNFCGDTCKQALSCVKSVIQMNPTRTLPGDYYNTLPQNLVTSLKNFFPCACSTPEGLYKAYPTQDDALTVTVWYNNQVCGCVCVCVCVCVCMRMYVNRFHT